MVCSLFDCVFDSPFLVLCHAPILPHKYSIFNYITGPGRIKSEYPKAKATAFFYSQCCCLLFYHLIILLFYCFITLLFCYFIVLLFYYFIVLLLYCFIALLHLCVFMFSAMYESILLIAVFSLSQSFLFIPLTIHWLLLPARRYMRLLLSYLFSFVSTR